jgi:biopolymer transport protein ExbB
LNKIKKVFLFEQKDKFADYKFITTKRNYLKLLKLEKWQTLKESTSNGGGMVSGLIIMACIGVGY